MIQVVSRCKYCRENFTVSRSRHICPKTQMIKETVGSIKNKLAGKLRAVDRLDKEIEELYTSLAMAEATL